MTLNDAIKGENEVSSTEIFILINQQRHRIISNSNHTSERWKKNRRTSFEMRNTDVMLSRWKFEAGDSKWTKYQTQPFYCWIYGCHVICA